MKHKHAVGMYLCVLPWMTCSIPVRDRNFFLSQQVETCYSPIRPPYSPDIQNTWRFMSIPTIQVNAIVLRHGNNFIFLVLYSSHS